MELIIYFIAIVLISLTGLTIINVLTFPRLRNKHAISTTNTSPLVSILIPARNEANVIHNTVTNLLSQTYKHIEVLVLDDNSTDATKEILTNIKDKRFRVIDGQSLPNGWMGKSWACHQLSQEAQGEILVFTDADVQWAPDGLQATVQQMSDNKADLFSVWSTQQTVSMSERLTVPLMAYAILTYLPTFMTHYSPFSIFAAANGQCMVWKRHVYHAINGHKAVANNVLDDVNLARIVKKAGFTLRMTDANKRITCRMYDDWPSVRDGFAKNILAGYGNSVLALSISIIFHFIIYLLPCILLIMNPEYRIWSALFIVQAILIRALSASFTHQRLVDAIAMPLSVIIMSIISIRSIAWHYTGGPRWKGRTITQQTTQESHVHA